MMLSFLLVVLLTVAHSAPLPDDGEKAKQARAAWKKKSHQLETQLHTIKSQLASQKASLEVTVEVSNKRTASDVVVRPLFTFKRGPSVTGTVMSTGEQLIGVNMHSRPGDPILIARRFGEPYADNPKWTTKKEVMTWVTSLDTLESATVVKKASNFEAIVLNIQDKMHYEHFEQKGPFQFRVMAAGEWRDLGLHYSAAALSDKATFGEIEVLAPGQEAKLAKKRAEDPRGGYTPIESDFKWVNVNPQYTQKTELFTRLQELRNKAARIEDQLEQGAEYLADWLMVGHAYTEYPTAAKKEQYDEYNEYDEDYAYDAEFYAMYEEAADNLERAEREFEMAQQVLEAQEVAAKRQTGRFRW